MTNNKNAKARKLTATAPDGSKVTRSTKANYTHVVLCASTAAERAAKATSDADRLDSFEGEAHDYYLTRIAELRAEAERYAALPADEVVEWGAWAWSGAEYLARRQANDARRVWSHVVIVPVD